MENLSFIACEEIACATIIIVDDDIVEMNESFTISLGRTSDLNKRISLSPDSKLVTILDDDGTLTAVSLEILTKHVFIMRFHYML